MTLVVLFAGWGISTGPLPPPVAVYTSVVASFGSGAGGNPPVLVNRTSVLPPGFTEQDGNYAGSSSGDPGRAASDEDLPPGYRGEGMRYN